MRFSAIELSRVLAFVDLNELNPYGSISFARIVPKIVEKLEFSSFPKTFEELDESKGIKFEEGAWSGIPIQQMTVYNNGFLLDTRNGTDVSLQVLHEVFDWGVAEFGLAVPQDALQRVRYLSRFTFYSGAVAKVGGLPVRRIAETLSKSIADITGKKRPYEIIRIDVDFDRLEEKAPIAPFTIQHRITTPFEDEKFYTEAPLPTDLHIALVEQLEADILSTESA